MLTKRIVEAQENVKLGFWNLEGREYEVFAALSPNDQILWLETGLPMVDLLLPDYMMNRLIKRGGKGYVFYEEENVPETAEVPPTQQNQTPPVQKGRGQFLPTEKAA